MSDTCDVVRKGVRERESNCVLPSAVEPAAHLDPGPDGHDIYGAFGQALARVCVPLDPQTVLDNLQIEQPTQDGAVQSLRHCRRLLARYLTASSIPGRLLSSLHLNT